MIAYRCHAQEQEDDGDGEDVVESDRVQYKTCTKQSGGRRGRRGRGGRCRNTGRAPHDEDEGHDDRGVEKNSPVLDSNQGRWIQSPK